MEPPGPATNFYSLVDLYAGPGGLSLGFQLSGFFQPVVAVESNAKVAETYQNNLGAKVDITDVRKVEPKELLKVAEEQGFRGIDIVVGGPPCRPFTAANTGGTRWKKIREEIESRKKIPEHPDWFNFWRIVDELQPSAVVAENVIGFGTEHEVFQKFIERLESSGYVTDFCKLNAQYFGVPQRRRRIFIAGVKSSIASKGSVLPRNPPESDVKIITIKQAISDLPELSNDSPGSEMFKYRKGRPTFYQSLMRGHSRVLYDHIAHSVHPTMAERFQHIPQGYNLRKTWIEGKIPETSMQSQYVRGRTRKGFSQKTLENMHSNIYRRLKWEDVSYTITHVRKTVLIHPLQDRLLSVREAARLQSFPDWFRFSGSLSQQYQQIADAVPPLLGKAVALHIKKFIDNTSNTRKAPQIAIKDPVALSCPR